MPAVVTVTNTNWLHVTLINVILLLLYLLKPSLWSINFIKYKLDMRKNRSRVFCGILSHAQECLRILGSARAFEFRFRSNVNKGLDKGPGDEAGGVQRCESNRRYVETLHCSYGTWCFEIIAFRLRIVLLTPV